MSVLIASLIAVWCATSVGVGIVIGRCIAHRPDRQPPPATYTPPAQVLVWRERAKHAALL